ncbi:hypothetical protein B0I35DRAFT_481206 [Stachybotrys elegans]|uniref:Uncharacterized protein n=1 Tax=Stachybotrys elegans TaxID=80388 RepID=A0A8K0WML2_9HYPO|nr:hypothetical protein B0I35DRAFT_481206 [Stachybotrys elegans]
MSQFVGPTRRGRRDIISTEIGAVQMGGDHPSLLTLSRSVRSGVNSMMIHGMTYGGEQPGSTWPGSPRSSTFTTTSGVQSSLLGIMSDAIDYTARNQLILQTGVATRDLAFYLYKDPWQATDVYNGTEFRARDFTYEFLSPANFASDNFKVQGGDLLT